MLRCIWCAPRCIFVIMIYRPEIFVNEASRYGILRDHVRTVVDPQHFEQI